MKKNVIEITPVSPLNMSNFLLLPRRGILFFIRNPIVKNKELADLKNTI
jgi:hypothetical protein